MADSEAINVNGVILTPKILDTLKHWQNHDPVDNSIPEMYLNMIGNAQDTLIKAMADYDQKRNEYDKNMAESIIICLKDLIMIKEDLKALNYRK